MGTEGQRTFAKSLVAKALHSGAEMGTRNADQGNIMFNCQEIRNEFSQKYVSQDKTPSQPK